MRIHLEDDKETIVLAEDHKLGLGGPRSQNKPADSARFRLIDLGDRSTDSPGGRPPEARQDDCDPLPSNDYPGIALQKHSIVAKVAQFLRPEDGSWDPRPDFAGHF